MLQKICNGASIQLDLPKLRWNQGKTAVWQCLMWYYFPLHSRALRPLGEVLNRSVSSFRRKPIQFLF